jgi:hypothetical protein
VQLSAVVVTMVFLIYRGLQALFGAALFAMLLAYAAVPFEQGDNSSYPSRGHRILRGSDPSDPKTTVLKANYDRVMIEIPLSIQLEKMIGRDGEPVDELLAKFTKFTTTSRDIDMIVSLCNESLEDIIKLAHLLHVRHLYIYSKCGQKLPESLSHVVQVDFQVLPNVGREGHSFLTHILRVRKGEVYPAGWNLFLQAEVEAGLGDIFQGGLDLETANKIAHAPYDYLDLSQYRIQNPSIFRKELGDLCGFVKLYGRNKKDKDCSNMFVSLRGEFFATAKLLLQAPKEAKRQMEHLLMELEASGSDGLLGHYLERSWTSILGANPLTVPKKEPKFKYIPITNDI